MKLLFVTLAIFAVAVFGRKIERCHPVEESTTEAPSSSCPHPQEAVGNKCILYVEQKLNHTDARDYCISKGGKLYIINNEEEKNELQTHFFEENHFPESCFDSCENAGQATILVNGEYDEDMWRLCYLETPATTPAPTPATTPAPVHHEPLPDAGIPLVKYDYETNEFSAADSFVTGDCVVLTCSETSKIASVRCDVPNNFVCEFSTDSNIDHHDH